MDSIFWEKIASFWVSIRSADDYERTGIAVNNIVANARNQRQKALSLAEELLLGLDMEDDEDGY